MHADWCAQSDGMLDATSSGLGPTRRPLLSRYGDGWEEGGETGMAGSDCEWVKGVRLRERNAAVEETVSTEVRGRAGRGWMGRRWWRGGEGDGAVRVRARARVRARVGWQLHDFF